MHFEVGSRIMEVSEGFVFPLSEEHEAVLGEIKADTIRECRI